MWRRATIHLTIKYTLLFLGFLWLFSAGLYVSVHESLGQNFVEQVQSQVEQSSGLESPEKREQAAKVAADVAIDRFRNIIIGVNGVAVFVVPFGAYLITRRTLRPLIESQERQKQFVANASHELRTPLAILNGELELALRRSRNVEYYQNTLAASKAEVERMIQLANQLLILNQVDSQKASQRLTLEKIDLVDTLRQVCERYRSSAASRGIYLSLDIGADAAIINGNGRLVETALNNVVQNAVKYSPDGSPVNVMLRKRQDRSLHVVVENMSNTMTEQEAKKIFERFYQSRLASSHDGFGLGLAIARSILDLHKGDINAKIIDGKVSVVLDFRRA